MELKEIYASRARDYERLVAREDYQGNILKALQDIRALAGLDVVELGAGTGRLTCTFFLPVDWLASNLEWHLLIQSHLYNIHIPLLYPPT